MKTYILTDRSGYLTALYWKGRRKAGIQLAHAVTDHLKRLLERDVDEMNELLRESGPIQ